MPSGAYEWDKTCMTTMSEAWYRYNGFGVPMP